MKSAYLKHLLVLLLASVCSSFSYGQFVSNGWVYVDGDEFNGTTLDMTKLWRHLDDNCLIKNHELQFYTDSGNFAFGQDAYAHYLRIITKRETVSGKAIPYEDSLDMLKPYEPPYVFPYYNYRTFDYTSGAIVTRQPYKYGYFEIRFKAPAQKGLWPAFWLRGNPDEEIDIMELKGEKMNQLHWACHGPGRSAAVCGFWRDQICGGWLSFQNFNFSNPDYNKVSCFWLPNFIMWVVNGIGQKYVIHDYVGPMRVIANTAVASDYSPFLPGADQTTQLPAYFDIDYIRIWAPIDCEHDVLICNQLQNIYTDPTVNTGRTITFADGFCSNYVMPAGQAVSWAPFWSPNQVTHRDLIASERVVINPSSSILWGSDFTARISPCPGDLYTSIDTTGMFPIDSLDEGGGESMQGFKNLNGNTRQSAMSAPPNLDSPLPTSQFFSMQNSSSENCVVQIQDWNGNVLIKKTLSPGEDCEFNLSNLQGGYYLLKTIKASGTIIQKIYLVK